MKEITRTIVGDFCNAERPLDAVDLLQDTIKSIIDNYNKETEEMTSDNFKQPFLVCDIVVDLYNGVVHIYKEAN